jgi:hypothetical protein
MHEAILLNATPYQLSWFCTVPNVRTVHLAQLVRLCRVGQWLADTDNCSTSRLRLWQETRYFEFDYPARMGQIGERCSKKGNFVSRIDKRLHQATIDPRDWQFFNHPTPSQSQGLNQSGMSSSLPAPYPHLMSTLKVGTSAIPLRAEQARPAVAPAALKVNMGR